MRKIKYETKEAPMAISSKGPLVVIDPNGNQHVLEEADVERLIALAGFDALEKAELAGWKIKT